MPYIFQSSYAPSIGLRNPYSQAILSGYWRTLSDIFYERERISTSDGDFLDLDWSERNSDTLVVITHGMIGNSAQLYVKGMVKACNTRNLSALAWNCRGCSQEVNRSPGFYHGGDTSDLRLVLRHAIDTRGYKKIALIGFSLGGNITLKYLGEQHLGVDAEVFASAVFSVPCDMTGVHQRLGEERNRFYLRIMVNAVKKMMLAKENVMPGTFATEAVAQIRDFHDFEKLHAVPLFGYESVEEYWRQVSSIQDLKHIYIPTLMVNAQDDPILSNLCYPISIAERSRCFYFEHPNFGGHVGFAYLMSKSEYWSEQRAMEFLAQYL